MLDVADRRDLDPLLDLRDRLARMLLARRIQQWLPGELDADVLDGWLGDGRVFVVRDRQVIVASIVVLDTDPIWPDDPPRTSYVHLLMVAPDRIGSGLGVRVLEEAEADMWAAGAARVRLDAVENNTRLLDWYTDRGYRRVGTRRFDEPNWFDTALLEKRLVARAPRADVSPS